MDIILSYLSKNINIMIVFLVSVFRFLIDVRNILTFL